MTPKEHCNLLFKKQTVTTHFFLVGCLFCIMVYLYHGPLYNQFNVSVHFQLLFSSCYRYIYAYFFFLIPGILFIRAFFFVLFSWLLFKYFFPRKLFQVLHMFVKNRVGMFLIFFNCLDAPESIRVCTVSKVLAGSPEAVH